MIAQLIDQAIYHRAIVIFDVTRHIKRRRLRVLAMRRYLRNDIGMNLLETSDDRFREILFARREIAQERPCIDGTALAIRRNRNLLL